MRRIHAIKSLDTPGFNRFICFYSHQLKCASYTHASKSFQIGNHTESCKIITFVQEENIEAKKIFCYLCQLIHTSFRCQNNNPFFFIPIICCVEKSKINSSYICKNMIVWKNNYFDLGRYKIGNKFKALEIVFIHYFYIVVRLFDIWISSTYNRLFIFYVLCFFWIPPAVKFVIDTSEKSVKEKYFHPWIISHIIELNIMRES